MGRGRRAQAARGPAVPGRRFLRPGAPRVHPPCPRAPRASAAPPALSHAHRGGLCGWETVHSRHPKQKELGPQPRGGFGGSVPASSRGGADPAPGSPAPPRSGRCRLREPRGPPRASAGEAPPPPPRFPQEGPGRPAPRRRGRGGGGGSPYRPGAGGPAPRRHRTPPKLPAKRHPDINPLLSSPPSRAASPPAPCPPPAIRRRAPRPAAWREAVDPPPRTPAAFVSRLLTPHPLLPPLSPQTTSQRVEGAGRIGDASPPGTGPAARPTFPGRELPPVVGGSTEPIGS